MSGAVTSLILQVDGEIDMASAEEVVAQADQLLRHAKRGDLLVIDVANLQFIDSSGLSALVRIRRSAEMRDIATVLRGVPAHLATLLRVSGLDALLRGE